MVIIRDSAKTTTQANKHDKEAHTGQLYNHVVVTEIAYKHRMSWQPGIKRSRLQLSNGCLPLCAREMRT